MSALHAAESAPLQRNRARLVRMYRANPQCWPDGIDPKDPRNGEQWYRGHEAEWTDERIARLLGELPEAESHTRVSHTPSLTSESHEPWKTAGISRAKWYRQRRKATP